MNPERVKRILLIQVRADDDLMLDHESDCIRRRFGTRPVEIIRQNAVVSAPRSQWLDGMDALLIGGSGDFSVHHPDSRPWVTPLRTLLEEALHRKVPGLAICFGHQLLGMHLGQEVVTHPDYAELGTVRVHLTEEGRASALFAGMSPSLDVHSGHSDHVVQIPTGVDLLASNEATHTQAFRVRGTDFYSVQFHPDMSGAEARYRYLAYREGFAERLDPGAKNKADQFKPGLDESTQLIGRFYDLLFSQ
jgi:GMP synthase (glutamine-hydrolysing)